MNSNLIQEIFKYLYKKYRINYSKKEIKLALIIIIFIYYIVEHKEEYNLQLNSMIQRELISSLAKIGKEGIIENEIIIPVEKQLCLNNYISNVYSNFKVRKDSNFMQDICEMVNNYENINPSELVEFINLELEKDEIKEGKSIEKLIKKIAPKGTKNVLDNFSGIGETIFTSIEDKSTYIQLQDMDEMQCAISTILLIMHKYKNFSVINTNTLTYYDDKNFDLIISIPPFIMDTTQIIESYNYCSIQSYSKRDSWGSVSVSFDKMSINGSFITLVNTGALTSSKKADKYVRERLIREGCIKAIIELPERMLHGTGIKTSLLIIDRKQNSEITLINLDSKKGEKYLKKFQTETVQITEEGMNEIYEILYENKTSEIAMKLDKNNLLENSVLLPSLYICEEEKYEHHDLEKLLEERKNLEKKLKQQEEKYKEILIGNC